MFASKLWDALRHRAVAKLVLLFSGPAFSKYVVRSGRAQAAFALSAARDVL